MRDVPMSWPELEHAWDVALRRIARITREGKQRAGIHGEGYTLAERLLRDLDGAPAELAVAKLTGLIWHGPEPYTPGAPDVGADIEVRFTQHRRGCLILHDEDRDDRRFYQVVPGRGWPLCFTVVGWMLGEEGKDRERYWRTDTGRPAYFVPQGDLLHA